MKVNIKDLLNIYDYEIRKNCRNKKKLYIFERNKMQNISNIHNELTNNTYVPNKYNIFVISEPKYRIVMSLNIKDKVINHYLARHVLIPKLDKYLDTRVVATRTGYGLDYGIKLIKKYLEINKKYNNFYILKMDIKKYFYNINHNVLKDMLKEKLNRDEYLIISRIIDSTNREYVNEDIIKAKERLLQKYPGKKEIEELPTYKYDKGLSLGAMVSQFLSIYYSHELIFYIVHKLGLKYSCIYMLSQEKYYVKLL